MCVCVCVCVCVCGVYMHVCGWVGVKQCTSEPPGQVPLAVQSSTDPPGVPTAISLMAEDVQKQMLQRSVDMPLDVVTRVVAAEVGGCSLTACSVVDDSTHRL